jgi:hypothetical protein
MAPGTTWRKAHDKQPLQGVPATISPVGALFTSNTFKVF